MRKVFGIGETVLDIVFRNWQPEAAVPGGSTFNSMITLGRCGIDATLLSEVGNDRVGSMIKDFMVKNGVHTEQINTLQAKSPVSLAFLNDRNEAEYSFYRDKLEEHPDFVHPELEPDDIVLFGSFYALNPVTRPQLKGFLEYARERGALFYYDVNFRPSHIKDLGNIGGNLWENFEYADIIRGSRDDFHTLFGLEDVDEVYRDKIASYSRHFIYTRGADPLSVRGAKGFGKEYPVAPIRTISTIGAGDSFNAGFIFGMVRYGITKEMISRGLSETLWDRLVECAQSFSADCCRSRYNYVTPEFGARVGKEIEK